MRPRILHRLCAYPGTISATLGAVAAVYTVDTMSDGFDLSLMLADSYLAIFGVCRDYPRNVTRRNGWVYEITSDQGGFACARIELGREHKRRCTDFFDDCALLKIKGEHDSATPSNK